MLIKRDLPEQIVNGLNNSLRNHLDSCSDAMTLNLNKRQDQRHAEIISALQSLTITSSAPSTSISRLTQATSGLEVSLASHKSALTQSHDRLNQAIQAVQIQSRQIQEALELSLQRGQDTLQRDSQIAHGSEHWEALRREIVAW